MAAKLVSLGNGDLLSWSALIGVGDKSLPLVVNSADKKQCE